MDQQYGPNRHDNYPPRTKSEVAEAKSRPMLVLGIVIGIAIFIGILSTLSNNWQSSAIWTAVDDMGKANREDAHIAWMDLGAEGYAINLDEANDYVIDLEIYQWIDAFQNTMGGESLIDESIDLGKESSEEDDSRSSDESTSSGESQSSSEEIPGEKPPDETNNQAAFPVFQVEDENNVVYTSELLSFDEDYSYYTDEEKIQAEKKRSSIPLYEKEGWIADGYYEVGKDLAPGKYFVVSHLDDYSPYITIYQAGDGSTLKDQARDGQIEYIETYQNFGMVDLSKEGEIVEILWGSIMPLDNLQPLIPEDGIYKSGFYRVGVDIPPGSYQVQANEDADYHRVSAYSDLSMDFEAQKDSSDLETEHSGENEIYLEEGDYLIIYNAYIDTNQ